MNRLLMILAAVFTVHSAAVAADPAPQPETASLPVPTIAVLPFDSRGARAQDENLGKSIAELLSVELATQGDFELVERAELDKILTELHLSATGLVDKETQLKLGQLTGAKILITGSVFRSGDNNYVVAKLIGVETGKVLPAAAKGGSAATDLVSELAVKVAGQLTARSRQLMPRPKTALSVAGELSGTVKGNGRKVYVKIAESISAPAIDPAAETELKKLLIALGFEVVEDRQDAEFLFLGEGLATDSGRYQNFSSSTARLELNLYKGKQILLSDRQKETVAGPSYVIAAKDADTIVTGRGSGHAAGTQVNQRPGGNLRRDAGGVPARCCATPGPAGQRNRKLRHGTRPIGVRRSGRYQGVRLRQGRQPAHEFFCCNAFPVRTGAPGPAPCSREKRSTLPVCRWIQQAGNHGFPAFLLPCKIVQDIPPAR